MAGQAKKLLGTNEKILTVSAGVVVLAHLFFWKAIKANPLISVSVFAVVAVAAAGWWFWANYRLVGPAADRPLKIRENLEGILHSLFLPRGFDIIVLPTVDQEQFAWAELRDSHGIGVCLQYIERPVDQKVTPEELGRLDERMRELVTPKGICLATAYFSVQALAFARSKNILTKDSDELVEMLRRAEQEAARPEPYRCRYCGSRLEEREGITGYMVCVNPDCRKEFSVEELEEEKKERKENLQSITISCYGCGRPVQLDTTMNGLMECPYADCSWIINVDNELLALQGGLDKKVSERLAEITCPRCHKLIKVPADAEGLMECPCEEKWIIDVGAALGERAQAHAAESLGGPPEAHGGTETSREEPPMVDCPGCGAGLPAGVGQCPVCGSAVAQTREQTGGDQEVTPEVVTQAGPASGQVTHRHAFMAMSTAGLLLFFALSLSAFLMFVYLVTQ